MNKNINIHYLYNSGFTVETENYLMIFDYYIDSVENGEKCISNGAIGVNDLKTNKKVLVFVSHKHQDHYNPVIFEWSKEIQGIEYILSNDIKKWVEFDSSNNGSSNSNGAGNDRYNSNSGNSSGSSNYGAIHKMQAYKELQLSEAYIRTFGSTDVGVSFLVTVDGATIFHAGDLNWWYWYNSTEQENKEATGMFKAEIEKIKKYCCEQKIDIDITFFPVDKRLEEAYGKGAEYFIDKMKPGVLIPMHFGESFEATSDFAEMMKRVEVGAVGTKVVEIDHRGQEINIIRA